jgi:capsule polysaccharide modification protein KpsS
MIKNIAKSMPADHLLLVKEHPASYVRSWRDIKTYKELAKIPGVVLIHPDADSQELIKKSSLVISICSSSSLDAVFLKKPTIVFADTNFSMIPDIHRLMEIEKLPEVIKKELDKKINPKHIEKYIQFIENNSFEYNFILHGQEMQEFLYHGGLLVDVKVTEKNMNVFLENTKPRFQQLKNAYLECIKKDL